MTLDDANLIFVRHAEPRIDPAAPASTWRLTEAGRSAAARAGRRLAAFSPAACFTSPEPKAVETAVAIVAGLGVPAIPVAGLAEHARESVPFLPSPGAFRDRVREVFERPDHVVFGEESATAARERFSAAVDTVMAEPPGGPVVVVSHGTVISLYVGSRASVEPLDLWSSLGFGGWVVMGWRSGQVLAFDGGDTSDR